ncbi:MAG: CDP-abequose synthase [Syntrophus sp. SKADARSKE-3]|nr:CDP-abequose synthase [Syntrophus sp. SKADARSKE-3]
MLPRCAFVTGAAGFIGSRLTRRLVSEGWTVHCMIKEAPDSAILADLAGRIHIHVRDGSTGQLCRIFENAKPDCVFHLASLFLADHGPEDVPELIESNLSFPASLLDAMARCGINRLVNTGTSWQYDERGAVQPVNLYAATKEAFEDIIRYYVDAHGLKVVTLVLYDTYGPGDPRRKLVNLLLGLLQSEEPLFMSPGEQRIDLVHVNDVIEAFRTASELLLTGREGDHGHYAVTSGDFLSLKEIVALFEAAAGRKLNVQFGKRPYRTREVMNPWHGLEVLPGWRPTFTLATGFADMLAKGK